MKLRSIALAVLSTAGLGLASAGPAAAHQPVGPMYDATFSGPSGVVWSGQCPALISEDDNDWLPELCRPHGRAQAGFLLDKGITSVRYATAEGQTVFSATLSADTFNTITYVQPGTSPEHVILDPSHPYAADCPVLDGDIVVEGCVKSGTVAATRQAVQRSLALSHARAKAATRKQSAKRAKAARHHDR